MGWQIFGFFGVRHSFLFTVSKSTRIFVLEEKSKVFFILVEKMGQFIKNGK